MSEATGLDIEKVQEKLIPRLHAVVGATGYVRCTISDEEDVTFNEFCNQVPP